MIEGEHQEVVVFPIGDKKRTRITFLVFIFIALIFIVIIFLVCSGQTCRPLVAKRAKL